MQQSTHILLIWLEMIIIFNENLIQESQKYQYFDLTKCTQ